MNSIRNQLLFWLVPSFVIIASIAGISLYLSEKRRLNNNLDNELSKLVRAVKLANKRPPSRFGSPMGIGKNLAENAKLILNNENTDFYLQYWNEAGETLSKSLSLGEQQLSFPNEKSQPKDRLNNDSSNLNINNGFNNDLSDSAIEFNSKLSSGDDIRTHAFKLRGGPRRGALSISVALSTKENNQYLQKFALQLIVGGGFCCFLLSVILIFTIRRTLMPLENLSEQVGNVEAGSLHNRLIDTGVPKEISPLVERLNQLLARLELSFSRERQFNNDLAHELRTPLAAIRTTSEVALKWPEQSSLEDYEYIAESSTQLQQTIDSLLSLARIENTGAEILIESVNVLAIIEECLSLQAMLIKERNIVVIVLVEHQYFIQSDPRLLRIIVSNLVSNAVEYAPINSDVTLSCEDDTIITVSNNAPNLNEGDIATMFDRLWRKDTSRTGTKHVGLGLSIAHTAAHAMSLKLTAKLNDKHMLKMCIEQS